MVTKVPQPQLISVHFVEYVTYSFGISMDEMVPEPMLWLMKSSLKK